jgi:small conductance mechanosensitive channel
MENVWQLIRDNTAAYGIRLVTALIIFLIGWWLAKGITGGFARLLRRSHVDETLVGFLKNLIYFALLVFVFIAVLDRLGVQTTSLVALLGAAGLAVGRALQGTLSNFGAGVLVKLINPFKAGDFIRAGGELGTVNKVSIFNTILSSPDNRKIIMPNSKVMGDSITNFSDIDKRRVDLVFGISYGDNIKTAKQVLEKTLAADARVLRDPAPVVAVSELAESGVNIVCRPWVKPADYWGVYFDTLEKGKAELEAAGITIPFPQRDVHLIGETKSLESGS